MLSRRGLYFLHAPVPRGGRDRRGGGCAAARSRVIVAGRGGVRVAFDRRADRNVLLVTIDTLRADALGATAARRRRRTSTRWRRGRPLRLRARARGRSPCLARQHPHRPLSVEHGVRDNSGYRLSPAADAATLLKARGFATGAFVGGFRSIAASAWTPASTFTTTASAHPATRPTSTLASASGRAERGRRPRSSGSSEADTGNWFTWVHVYDPHAPIAPPPPFARSIAGRSVSGRGRRGPTPRSARCSIAASLRPADAGRRHRRPRRRPRRSRRADTRTVRLRDALCTYRSSWRNCSEAMPAQEQVSHSLRGTSTCCRRSSTRSA